MNFLDGVNGFGRDVVFRPIEFERYRKPCVVSYPRHAVVLNPQHTLEHRNSVRQNNGNGHSEEVVKSNESSSWPLSSSDGNNNNNNNGDDEVDDDDPLFIEENMMLCRDEQLSQSLHLRWKQIGPSGCGLQNLGNTCFANSTLQAIAHTPALAQYFAATFKAPCSNLPGAPYDYAYALGETIRQIHASSNGVYRPGLILSNMKLLSPHFRIGRQSDAHEFAVQLLHACHKTILFRQVGSKKMPPRVEQTNTLQRIIGGYLRSRVSWSADEEIHRLKTVGKVQEATDLRMRLKSKSSKNKDALASNTFDPFIILNVEVAGQTLVHCLKKFCEKERLDGRSYHTPRGVGVRATKQFEIHKPPNVLVIHVKRFNAMGAKINKFVEYPKILNLAPYCSMEGLEKAIGKHNMNVDEPKYLYELSALCVHEGRALNYGHYYSVVRARNGTWLLYDDEMVSRCSEERALRQQAYMLFYSKIEVSSPQRANFHENASHKRSNFHENASHTMANGKTLSTNMQRFEEETKLELGRELTNDELERITKHRMSQKKNSLLEEVKKDAEEDLSRHKRLNGLTNGSHLQTNKELNHDADKANHFINGQNKLCISPEESSEQLPCKDHPRHMRNGIVKVIRHQNLVLKTDTKVQNEQTMSDERERISSITGENVVAAVEDMKNHSVPRTVARPLYAPQFRQRVRDPIWEEEMDRGRVKKVRVKSEVYNDENRFQDNQIQFDRRGRRVQ